MNTQQRFALALGVLALFAASCGRGIDEGATGVTAAPTTTAPVATTAAGGTEVVEATELVVWVPVRQRSAVQQAASAFTTATGIDVAIESFELDEMEQALNSGVGPDIYMGQHTWLARLVPRGLATPLNLDSRRDEFVPPAIDAFTFDGAIYGAPVTMESIALFHNASLSPTAPGAFSEIKEACVQLRGPSGDDTTTTTTDSTTTTVVEVPELGCLEYEGTDSVVSLALITAGDGYLYRRVEGEFLTGDIGITSAAAVARSDTMRSLAVEGVVAAADDQSLMVAQFVAGDTPFVIGGIDLAEALSIAGTPFGAAPLPILTGTSPEPYVDVAGFMISGRSNEPETAVLFLNDYLVTDGAMANLFASSTALPAFEAAAQVVAGDPVLSGLLASARAGVPTPIIDGIDDLLAALGPVLAQVIEVGGIEVAAVLGEAESLARALGET